jgi:hypothetical protein
MLVRKLRSENQGMHIQFRLRMLSVNEIVGRHEMGRYDEGRCDCCRLMELS